MPGLLHSALVAHDTTAWPTIVRTRADELIIVFSGDRDDHICPWGKMEMVRSTDDGETWTEPVRVVCSAPHGPVELSDGRLLYLGNGTIDGEGVVAAESTDQGRNWKVIGTAPRPEGIGLGEPHVVEAKSGKLVGLLRWGIARIEDKYMWQAESYDGGKTWTLAYKTTILGYPPHLIRLKDDRILLVYGLRLPPFGQRARVSEDEGESWSAEIVLCEGLSNDLGYPALTQLEDDSILTVYYQIENPGETTCLMGTRWRLG